MAATARIKRAKHAKRAAPDPWDLGYVPHYNFPPLCVRNTCSRAARGGHQEVLQWLHNTGCPCDVWTSYMAARGGHRKVLK